MALAALPRAMAETRILVVDDQAPVRAALRRWFEPRAQVDVVATYEEALARITAHPAYDHILCDLVMPGISAESFFEQLLVRAPQAARRVIFMTGGASEDVLAFVRRTKLPLLEKPFDMAMLGELILDVRAAS